MDKQKLIHIILVSLIFFSFAASFIGLHNKADAFSKRNVPVFKQEISNFVSF